jgi:hypothetical protein
MRNARCEMQDAKCKMRDTKCEMRNERCEMRDFAFRISHDPSGLSYLYDLSPL